MKRLREIFVTVVVFLLLFSAVAYGITWSTNERLTKNAGSSLYPALATEGTNIYVVWHDNTPGNYEIYFKKSDDGGVTWSTNERLTNNAGGSYSPDIAVHGSNIYVVWYDNTPGNYEIYFKESDYGGIHWSIKKSITKNAGDSRHPAIAVDGSNIYVVWQDDATGNYEAYFRWSDDGGVTCSWTAGEKLTNNKGDSRHPAIAVDGSNIYVVWQDDATGNYEAYFRWSDDGGVTCSWTAGEKLTNNKGDSRHPAVAVDGSNIYVVWYDDTPGNYDIYFKKGNLY
jgi:hypothetical protein